MRLLLHRPFVRFKQRFLRLFTGNVAGYSTDGRCDQEYNNVCAGSKNAINNPDTAGKIARMLLLFTHCFAGTAAAG